MGATKTAVMLQACQTLSILKPFFTAAAVQAFLQHECQIPERLGYDRPSPKFLHFLQKYFGEPHAILPMQQRPPMTGTVRCQLPSGNGCASFCLLPDHDRIVVCGAGLKHYTPQNNKYVVFEDYWQQVRLQKRCMHSPT